MRGITTLFLCLMVGFLGLSQEGILRGTVTDGKTGEALFGVKVKIVGEDKGAVTDFDGKYEIKGLSPKTYALEAFATGYKPEVKYNIVVRSGGNPDVDFVLQEEATDLEGVEIVANPFKKDKETPLSSNKLSQEEIATYPGGNNDIAKVVQSLPGVSGSVGGFRNDVIIRGGAPNENVYYLDGIEIPNINHFSTQGSAGGPVGLLNVSFFEGVTLSTSSFGAQYDNVLSGVLQFEQRTGNAREMKTNFRLSSSEAALTLEGPLFKRDNEEAKTTYIISARRSYLQFLFQVLDLPFLPDYWDYQYKINHKINKYNELNFTGVGSLDDFAVNVPDEFDAEQQATLEQIPIIKQWSTTSGLSWKKRFKDVNGYMLTAVSTNILNNNFKRYQDNINLTGLYLNNVSQEQETKARYYYKRFYDKWELAFGGVVQNVDYSNTTTNTVSGFNYQNGLNFWKYGAFVQASTKVFKDKLSISGGLRFDGNDFTKNGNDIYRTLSPRAALSYSLDKKQRWSLNASVGRYFKLPSYTILGFTDNQGMFANRDVDYIQSDHLVAGVEFLLNSSTKFTVEGFYKKYSNYPVSLTDSVSLANLGGDFSVLGNEPVTSIGLGRTYGVELLAQKKFTKHFYGVASVTFYKSEFTSFDEDVYLPSAWDNKVLISLTGGYKFGNNWELSARTRFLGKTPYAPVDVEASEQTYPALVKDYNRLGEEFLTSFNQTDIRIDKKWNFEKWTLDIYFEVQNVFGQATPSEPSYGLVQDENGMPVQPIELKQFPSVASGTVLPSLGIVVDF